jgi:hypothetical protein
MVTMRYFLIPLSLVLIFTPLESPSIYAGDDGNKKHQFLFDGMVKTLPFLTGFIQLPFGPQPSEKPEEEKSPVKGWKLVSYFATPPTQYSRAGKGIIKAESLGGRASLFKDVEEKKRDYSILSWKWKISNIIRSAIETKKDRFDAAARVMVIFGKESLFRGFGGEPSGLKIEYIWATHLPQGHVFDYPGEKNCKVFVLESGEGKAGRWVYEERNIRKDYKTAFGIEPEGLLAIGIQTDTDHSNEMVTTYYSDPILKRK